MTGQPRILVVDDDHVFVDATRAVLESKDYKVSVAYDGDEGLQKARDEKPDAIILDIIMPTTDGFTVCEQLKEDPELAGIPVLVLTSFAKDKGQTNIPESAGLTLEAEDYLDKPVDPAELINRIEKLLQYSG
jgi:CheY-like chemotaxis protein